MKEGISSYAFLPVIQYNPTELVWCEVVKKNILFIVEKVEPLLNEETHSMTQDFWTSSLKHTENGQEKYYSK
jgi:hypothetical protein